MPNDGDIPFSLTVQQRKEANRLCSLLNFGADCLRDMKIDLRKIRARKRLLLFMMVASHNLTESVYMLSTQGRTHACFVLLRSLLENRINAKALYATSSLDGVYHFEIYSYGEQKKMLEEAIKLNLTVPRDQLQFRLADADIRRSINAIDKNIKTLEKRVKGDTNFKSLYNRAIVIDTFNRTKKKKSASLQSEYSIYRHLCSDSHLTSQGLSRFISIRQDGRLEFFLCGNPADVEMILQHGFYLYESMLRMFFVCFNSVFLKELDKVLVTIGKQ